MTRPVFSFGVKKVDLGGISRPSRAVRSISATLTGRISTAALARPIVDLGQRLGEPVLIGHAQDVGEAVSSQAPSSARTPSNRPGCGIQPPGTVGL